MHRTQFFTIFIGIIVFCITGSVSAFTVFHDDFSSQYIKPNKWTSLEFVREVDTTEQAFISKVGSKTGNVRNRTRFQNPGTIHTIQADIEVNDSWLKRTTDTHVFARIGLMVYNSQAGGSDMTGDVMAFLAIREEGNGLALRWSIEESLDNSGLNWDIHGSGSLVAAGALFYNIPYTVKLSYLEGTNQITFSFNGQSTMQLGPTFGRSEFSEYAALTTGINATDENGEGYISVSFDNVYINNEASAYDTFDTAPLSSFRWKDYEEVRELKEGVLRLFKQGCSEQQDMSATVMNDGDHTDYFSAVVRVDSGSLLDTGTTGIARIGGYFYNDSRGIVSNWSYRRRLGDVWVENRLILDDTGNLMVRAGVYRSNNSDFSSVYTWYEFIYAANLFLDTDYLMSIELSGTTLTFTCGANTTTYMITTDDINPPYSRSNVLTSRVYLDPGECGYMKATFDNVMFSRPSDTYDDFESTLIFQDKWGPNNGNAWEIVRDISSTIEKLQLHVNACNQDTTVQSPLVVNDTDYLRADVNINSNSFVGHGASGIARIVGYFYNEGAGGSYDGRLNDVWAEIRIWMDENRTLGAQATAWRSDDSDFTTYTELFKQSFINTIPSFDTNYTMAIDFTGTDMKFTFNGEELTYTVAIPNRMPSSPWRTLQTRVYADLDECAYMKVFFDNVYNEKGAAVYDDFSSTSIDLTKWQYDHWVRENREGKVQMDLAGCDEIIRNPNPLIANRKNYLSTDVMIQSTTFDTDVWGKSRLSGYFYNQSGPPYNGYTNDVFVQVFIQANTDGTLTPKVLVTRMDTPDGSSETLLFSHDFTTPVLKNWQYFMSAHFTGTALIFKFRTETVTYPIATATHPPSAYYKAIESRIYASGTGGCGYMQTRFDDVFLRPCFLDPVKFYYDGPAGSENVYCEDIQTALDNVSSTTGDIYLHEYFFTRENLVFDQNMAITLMGGNDCNFSTESGFSTIIGSLTVNNGSITVKNILIK